MDITIDFGLFTLTITKYESICIYKHFSKRKNLKQAFGTQKAPTLFGQKLVSNSLYACVAQLHRASVFGTDGLGVGIPPHAPVIIKKFIIKRRKL